MPVNMEIKARCKDPNLARAVLKALEADFIGLDRQRDTYFNVPNGRLKLRTGNIENALIHYDRANQDGPKSSQVTLFPTTEGRALRDILEKSLGIKAVVDKEREIYFLGNVKFHIDKVATLGDFVEIEVIDRHGNIPAEELLTTCRRYMQALDISEDDLVSDSYSDQILRRMQ
jgi:adenylate cyclase class 2